MEVITKFRSESINGIKLDILKSAIQKFLRRDECAKGLGTLKLLSNFNNGSKDGDKITSNVINRLVVMMSEEICINNPTLPINVRKLYEKFKETKNYDNIYKIYKLLCNSKKCRLLSDIVTTFCLRPYYIDNLDELVKKHKKLLGKDPISKMYEFKYDEEETLEFIKVGLIACNECETFMYLSHYLRNDYSVAKLWKIIIKCANEDVVEIIKSLKFFYTKMTHREKPLYLYQSIMTIIHEKTLELDRIEVDVVISKEDFEEIRDIKDFPDYVIDKHTKEGRAKGSNAYNFAIDGAFIKNECGDYKNDRYRKYYLKFKKILNGEEADEGGEISIDLFKDCVRGQKLTSTNKPWVYIPEDEKYKGYVYKGPYNKNGTRCVKLIERIKILGEMDTKFVLIPEIIEQENDIWFKYKFLGKYEGMKYELYDGVKILDRESIGIKKMSTLSEDEIYERLFDEDMILSFLDLIILEVGDLGLWNVIIGVDDVGWIIDFEDTSGKDLTKCSKYDIFTKTSKKNVEIIREGFEKHGTKIKKHLEMRREMFSDNKIVEILMKKFEF